MAYLAAISTATTIPLFIRTKGDLPPLSFPVVGSLASVHLYASNMRTALHSCSSAGSEVIWKCYYDCVTLILVRSSEGGGVIHSTHLLELVGGTLVLLVGRGELEGEDTERLKRALKCCYPLVDHLLGGFPLLSPLTQCPEVMVSEYSDILLKTLEAFAEAAQSNFGCLTIHGRVCVATESWWGLSSLEQCLLSLLLLSLPPATSSDIPIYLPHASCRVPHRLLTFTLLEGVLVSVLCNPQPPLTTVQDLLPTYWAPVVDQLQESSQLYPANLPMNIKPEAEIQAFCFVNLEAQRCVTSLRPMGLYSRTTLSAGFQGDLSEEKKLRYLSRFIRHTVDNLLPFNIESKGNQEITTLRGGGVLESSGDQEVTTLRGRVAHKILETYTHAKRYKAYAIHKDKFNLFVIFTPSVPTFALRKMSGKLLEQLHSHKILTI